MYRETQSGVRPINIIFDDGGIGDCVARLPAVKYICDNHKHIKANLWVPKFFKEFAENALRDTKVNIFSIDDKDNFKEYVARCFNISNVKNLAMHMTEHAFTVLVQKTVEPELMNYLPLDLTKMKTHFPNPYVVMTTGFTAAAREFYPEYINEVVHYIKSKGYDVVFLGQKTTETGLKHVIKGSFSDKIDYTQGIDLIGKTSLLEAAKVIEDSKGIVGLDNGLLHIAACTDVPIVGGFSTVEPKYRMPYRKGIIGWNYFPVVPAEDLKCRFCQSNWTFTFSVDFKECYYDDYQCIKNLTPNLYIEQLEKFL